LWRRDAIEERASLHPFDGPPPPPSATEKSGLGPTGMLVHHRYPKSLAVRNWTVRFTVCIYGCRKHFPSTGFKVMRFQGTARRRET
jgi:hypothetical protein